MVEIIEKTARIRELNDAFRKSFAGGRVTMTAGLAEEPEIVRALVLQTVADYDQFGPNNDPHKVRIPTKAATDSD
jgi:hypothetical protein